MKSQNILIIVGIVAIALIFVLPKISTNFAITGSETMSRNAPSSVTPGQTFTLTYSAIGTSGSYGASVVDSVSGGCTPSNLQFVLTSPATTYQVTMTAPASGTCTIHGDYKYGEFSAKPFTDTVIKVCTASCNRPTDKCIEASTISNGCEAMCTGAWTVTKKTPRDANCDNVLDRNELGTSITKWTNSQLTRDELGVDIQAWSSV